MKIIDLTLTLFKWEGIPVGLAKRHTGRIGGDSQIGLLAISTDEGIKGHSFLGASGRSAEFDAGSLIHYLKPILMDQNPLCLLYTSPSPRDRTRSRMPSSA